MYSPAWVVEDPFLTILRCAHDKMVCMSSESGFPGHLAESFEKHFTKGGGRGQWGNENCELTTYDQQTIIPSGCILVLGMSGGRLYCTLVDLVSLVARLVSRLFPLAVRETVLTKTRQNNNARQSR